MGLVAWQSTGTAGTTLQPVVAGAGTSATGNSGAADARRVAAALQVRDRALVSRGEARSTMEPTPGPDSAAVAPAPAPEPVDSSTTAEQTPVAVPTSEPAPEPAPEPVPVVVGQLWATTDVNVRSGPSAGDELIGHLAGVTQVDVTGATENGWTQVILDGRAGWVNASYLSESRPEPQAARATETAGLSSASCAISPAIESSLTADARAVYRAVCAAHGGSVSSFGGYRSGDDGDHGSGRAVDIMVSGEPGWVIARYVQAHAAELGVTYVIYQQRIWQAGNATSRWELMADRGSVTANHYDHVHVSV